MFFRARRSLPVLPTAPGQSRPDSGSSAVIAAILLAVIAGLVIALVALLGGGKETVASRSAAAFEDAQSKGVPVGEAAHGHGAVSPANPPSNDARPEEPGAGHAGHAGMETPGGPEKGMTHGEHAMPGRAPGGGSPHAGMHHGTSTPGSGAVASPHVGMHHGTSASPPGASQPPTGGPAGHAGHGSARPAPADNTASAPTEPLPKAAVASPGQPAATLQPDPLDSPAVTSKMDAKRSAEIAAQMGSGGHGAHGTVSYVQIDAGRESVPRAHPAASGHEGMDHGSMPAATPTPGPGPRKPRPAATPLPTPSGHVHPGGGTR